MEELKEQIDILINKTEEKHQLEMLHGFTSDMRESEGELHAYKFIKLLINTNLKLSI